VEDIVMRLPRASGILLHPSSLPGRFGIGDFGPQARTFVDLLAEAGQLWWQILPLGPTGYGNSPYQSYSSFAGNPLLISPEVMAEDGWLGPGDWTEYPELSDDSVDFDAVIAAKDALFRRSFRRFRADQPDFGPFVRENSRWLDDYALFMALKETFGGAAWNEWEPELAVREPEAIARAREELVDKVLYYQFIQYVFARQWDALRERCRARGIRLIGDLPIFVAQDSADVWSHPELFQLDADGRPLVIAGVPPDLFSETGQLWGNPLYRWEAHASEKFAWWIARMKASTDRVDLVRLDHFRGFEAYWEVPAGSETAATGRWALGPGTQFLEALRDGLGGLPLIAEDLGDITAEVLALRDRFGLPGMRVLQFGFSGDKGAEIHLPHSFVHHCIAYTGTHDNDTTVGWFTTTDAETTQTPEQVAFERSFVRRYVGTDGEEVHWDLIRAGMASVADTMIVPVQDLLGLDSQARINVPGRARGNWGWRLRQGQLTPEVLSRLAEKTATYDRWNGEPSRTYRPPRRHAAEERPLGR
jgi:4-alpha-glucanotransferase